MMTVSDLELFQFDGYDIRRVEINGELWFVASDVCAALGIANPSAATDRLPSANLGRTEVIDTIGRMRLTVVVNRTGLMKLTFRSDKPRAVELTEYVIEVVIPEWEASRAAPPVQRELSPRELAALVIAAEDAKDAALTRAIEAERVTEAAKAETHAVKQELTAVAPDLDYLKDLLDSPDWLDINQSAKEIARHVPGFGPKMLFQLLRDGGEIFKHGSQPTQKAITAGRMVQSGIKKRRHDQSTYTTGLTTPRGRYEYTGMLLGLRNPLAGMNIHSGEQEEFDL